MNVENKICLITGVSKGMVMHWYTAYWKKAQLWLVLDEQNRKSQVLTSTFLKQMLEALSLLARRTIRCLIRLVNKWMY